MQVIAKPPRNKAVPLQKNPVHAVLLLARMTLHPRFCPVFWQDTLRDISVAGE
jgi:hypothetical protein